MAGEVADKAVQVHGGTGYIREVPVERIYRDVRLLRLYEGHKRDPAPLSSAAAWSETRKRRLTGKLACPP